MGMNANHRIRLHNVTCVATGILQLQLTLFKGKGFFMQMF